MIQFNLLPDVKSQYIHAQALKRSLVTVCVAISGAALAILILLIIVVYVFQRQQLNNVNKDIKTYSDKLQSIPDLDKILTIQNQLNSLPKLHSQKPVTSRLSGYLSQVVPDKLSISNLSVDFDQHTLVFSGSADSIVTVNKFTDTLKFTTYSTGDNNSQAPNAFSGVVLASFSTSNKGVNYTINANFDSSIFDSSKVVTLTVPSLITTRSETEKPSNLFQEQGSTSNNANNKQP